MSVVSARDGGSSRNASPRALPSGPTGFEWLAIALAVAFVALLAFEGLARGHVRNGDSVLLVRGAGAIVHCVEEGVWRGCERAVGGGPVEIGPFPPLQYLPATVLAASGVAETAALRTLAAINLVSLVAALAAASLSLCRRRATRRLAPVFVLIVASGPVAYYATTAFGEMLAASLVLAAVLCAYRGRVAPTAALAALACLGKETLAPFVLALAALAVLASDRRSDRSPWSPVGAAAAGAATGALADAAFNVFRYGSVRNLNYLDPLFRVSDPERILAHFAMLNFAPAGGIAIFWPLAWAAILAALAVGLRRLARAPSAWRGWLTPLGVGASYLAFVAGLSLWYGPFGWLAWGPRLAVPVIPALVFLALVALEPAARRALDAIRRRPALGAGATLAVVALALPQLAGAWTHPEVIATLATPDATCAGMREVIVQAGKDAYLDCLSHVAWRRAPMWLDDALRAGGTPALAARVVGSLWIAALAAAAMGRPAGAGSD